MVNDVIDHRVRSVVFFIRLDGVSEKSGRGSEVVPTGLFRLPILQLPED